MKTRIVKRWAIGFDSWYVVQYRFFVLWYNVPIMFTRLSAAKLVRRQLNQGGLIEDIPNVVEDTIDED